MLNDLQRISATTGAKVTLTITKGYACLCVKEPGSQTEVIHDHPGFGSATALETIAARMLARFGIETYPQAEFIRLIKQRPAKLARLHALLAEIRELKRDVFAPIEELEPVLASPRSSLNPQFMEVERD